MHIGSPIDHINILITSRLNYCIVYGTDFEGYPEMQNAMAGLLGGNELFGLLNFWAQFKMQVLTF